MNFLLYMLLGLIIYVVPLLLLLDGKFVQAIYLFITFYYVYLLGRYPGRERDSTMKFIGYLFLGTVVVAALYLTRLSKGM